MYLRSMSSTFPMGDWLPFEESALSYQGVRSSPYWDRMGRARPACFERLSAWSALRGGVCCC